MRPGKESEAYHRRHGDQSGRFQESHAGNEVPREERSEPRPYFAGKSVDDENIKKAELTAAAGVIAKMIDFEFDLKFEMVEYKVTMIVNGGTPIEKMTKALP
jgi:hypothetical protein